MQRKSLLKQLIVILSCALFIVVAANRVAHYRDTTALLQEAERARYASRGILTEQRFLLFDEQGKTYLELQKELERLNV